MQEQARLQAEAADRERKYQAELKAREEAERARIEEERHRAEEQKRIALEQQQQQELARRQAEVARQQAEAEKSRLEAERLQKQQQLEIERKQQEERARRQSEEARLRAAEMEQLRKQQHENTVFRQGTLQRKAESDAGGRRSSVRSWKGHHTVVRGSTLYFFASPKDMTAVSDNIFV